jgi:hypothetical protein
MSNSQLETGLKLKRNICVKVMGLELSAFSNWFKLKEKIETKSVLERRKRRGSQR